MTVITKKETMQGVFELGQVVWVVQKTKQRQAKIIKLNERKAVIEMEGKQYRAPYSMLSLNEIEGLEEYHHELAVQRHEAMQN
tara:strand:- start:48 stop:296 length:249 start_codon:yes stop_codon:yes gene_type:complete